MKLFNLLPFLVVLQLTPAATAEKETPKHTCRILFFNAPSNAPSTLYLFDGATSQKVELPKMNFSPVYELRPGPLNLRLLPDPPENPAAIPAAAPSVAVKEGIVDFYLLVTSDPNNPIVPVSMHIINAGTDNLKAGQSLWFNLSGNTVGGILGSEKLDIQPGKREVLDAPASGAGDYPVNLAFQIPGDNQIYPLCETRWRHDPRSRSVFFIHAEPGRRSPRVMGFSDDRPPAPKPNP